MRSPIVLGGLYDGTDRPPTERNNNSKVLVSLNGVKISLEDQSGQESFIVETPGGQKATLKGGTGSLEIMDNNGNSVILGTNGITVNTSAKATINAGQVEVSSSMVNVNAGMTKFSGVVQCETLICDSVVSASLAYEPF